MKKALIKCFFAICALLAAPLGALSTSYGSLGLGASALGAGGAGVATVSASEALFWNPAALPDQGWDLGYSLASGGAAGSLNQALALSADMGQGLNVGLLVSDLRFPQASGFRESEFAGAASVSAGRWISLGTLQRLRQAEPGGLKGWSMDAGALAGIPLSGAWALRLGASASDLVSSLAWGNGLEEVQPTVLRLGLALEGRPGWWLALQQDHLDRAGGGGGGDQWRAGVQAAFFDQALRLRAGATQAQASGLYMTAGLGAKLPLAGQQAALDYAIMVPGDANEASALRQVLALRWRWHSGRDRPAAGLRNLIQDRGKVQHARIALAEGPKDTEAWQLDLRDSQGRVVRSFKGRGPLPPSVAWDGRDNGGTLVDAGGLSYDLRTTSAAGRTAERHSLLGPSTQALGALDQDMADMDAGAFGVRDASTGPASPVRTKPRLKTDGGLAVEGADFDLSGLQSGTGAAWSVRIRDESGRTVKEIKGRGSIPKTLRWEGKDDLGNPVDPGLGATFEIRVTDASGREQVTEDDLVQGARVEEARARARGGRETAAPEAPPEEAALPPSGCKVVDGQVVCTFHFAEGSAALGRQAAQVLQEAAFLSEGRQDLRLSVMGYAAPGEARALDLSQARADAVMRRLVEGREFSYTDVEATGRGEAGGGPAGRKVELSIGRRRP